MNTPLAALLAQADPGSPLGMLPLLGVFFVIFWFMILRPQQKQQKAQEKFLAELKKGDDVVTTGGMIGKIVQVSGKVITLEVAPSVKVRVLVSMVASAFVPQTEADAAAATEKAAQAGSDKK